MTNEPTLIFTTFIATARAIAKMLHVPRGAIDAFKRGEIDILVTTDFAAEGLNLQRAAVVIHYDIPWNPVKLDQRNGRAHRIGQTRDSVKAIYFIPAEDRTRVAHVIAAKNRMRRRTLSGAPSPSPAQPTAIRPRIINESKAIDLMQRLNIPPRRYKAGLDRLITEMSREILDERRIEYLLAVCDNLPPWTF